MSAVAIIPARGATRAVPRMHLRSFAGRPLIVHTVEQAVWSKSCERVVVTTDDPDVARIAGQAGAQIVILPPELAGDAATVESALIHTLDVLAKRDRARPEHAVYLNPACPVRLPGRIDEAIRLLKTQGADSLASAFPAHDLLWEVDQGAAKPINYDPQRRPRREDLPVRFRETGSVCVSKAEGLILTGTRLFGKVTLLPMTLAESIEIETLEDFELAETVYDHARRPGISAEVKDIKLLVLDFDGVMTDNRVLTMQDGTEGVLCNRSDGLGIGLLKDAGLAVLVLSKEANPVVSARCRKLKLDCRQGIDDKLTELKAVVKQMDLTPAQVAYVGNDINDLECMRYVGVPIAVADAFPRVRAAASAVTKAVGGAGAVREVIDWLLAARSA